MSFFEKLRKGISKARLHFESMLDEAIRNFKGYDEDFFDSLEEALILADVGADVSSEVTNTLKKQVREHKATHPGDVRNLLKQELYRILDAPEGKTLKCLSSNQQELDVILVVGVNGTGKTTSIGKLASYLAGEGKKVLIAGADTFRAAAMEQLEIWAGRANADYVGSKQGSDPSSVVHDGIHAAMNRKKDVLICDTAGRLHTKQNLMEELKKMKRVIQKEAPEARIETLIVLDASTGNNAMNQAEKFNDAIGIDGIVLTKLDGTAKGGIVITICRKMDIPVKLIGIGEKIDDLRPFDAGQFIDALF
ncbi:MAG: signal recognition particle-docking protein FtsY [Clostridia bacterium]